MGVGLQGRTIEAALSLLIPHIPYLGLPPVLLLPLEPHHAPSANLVKVSGVEFQWFYQGIDKSLVGKSGRDRSDVLLTLGVNDIPHGMLENVGISLRLRVLDLADRAPDRCFRGRSVVDGTRGVTIEPRLRLNHSRHPQKFILKNKLNKSSPLNQPIRSCWVQDIRQLKASVFIASDEACVSLSSLVKLFKYQIQVMISQHQKNAKGKVRVVAILLLLLEVGLMFAYGFGSQFLIGGTTFPTTSDNTSSLIFYMTSAIMALLGWGLIIAYSQNSAISGLTTTLITAGIFVQLAPPLIAFWDYLFNSSWAGRFVFNIYSEWITMWAVTSMLICFCFLSGRLGLAQTITTIVIFCIGWTLNFNLLGWIQSSSSTYKGQIENFDAIGTTYVYIFAAVVGLIISIAISRNPGRNIHSSGSRHSAFVGLIGTGFAFAAAPYTGSFAVNIVGLYQHPLNVYFALTASVIMTYASSAMFGGFKIGVRESLVGVLSGTVMIGAVASYINNIGGCIAVGAAAGFISGLWLRVVHPKINADSKIDQLGLIGPVLINGFIGSFIVAPIVFGAYKQQGITVAQLTTKVTAAAPATFYLAITFVTIAIAVGTGIIAAIICVIMRDPTDDFFFIKLVSNDYGLYNDHNQRRETVGNEEGGRTAQHLNRDENEPAATPV